MKFEIEYTMQAQEDLRNIYKYIADNLKVPEIATKLVAKIVCEIDSLCEMPKRFSLVKNHEKKGLRKLIVRNFIVFYYTQKTKVEIISIMYGRRNIDEILNNLSEK